MVPRALRERGVSTPHHLRSTWVPVTLTAPDLSMRDADLWRRRIRSRRYEHAVATSPLTALAASGSQAARAVSSGAGIGRRQAWRDPARSLHPGVRCGTR